MMEKANVGKGILFALGGALIGFAVWVALIAFLELGTGGVFGGVLAAGFGMVVAGAYQLGAKGKAGAIGFIVTAILSGIGAVAAIILGAGFIIHNLGQGSDVLDAVGILLDRFFGEVVIDVTVGAGIAIVMACVSLAGGNKKG